MFASTVRAWLPDLAQSEHVARHHQPARVTVLTWAADGGESAHAGMSVSGRPPFHLHPDTVRCESTVGWETLSLPPRPPSVAVPTTLGAPRMCLASTMSIALLPRLAVLVLVALITGACAVSYRTTAPSGGPGSADPESAVAPIERPAAHNTGPTDVTALESVHESIRIDTPGMVVENVDVRGNIDIRASNVTVRNFRVNAESSHYGIQVRPELSNVVIEDGEITNSNSAGVYCQSACILRRLYIHDHASDGMKLSGTNGPSLVEYSFVTRLGTAEGSHADGNQSVTGSNLTFRYNNFYMPVPGTEAHDEMSFPDRVTKYRSNAAFIIHDGTDNILIENNWLDGGNYTIYGNRGTVVQNNIFGSDFRYGICNGPFDDWSGNVMEDGTPFGDNDSCP